MRIAGKYKSSLFKCVPSPPRFTNKRMLVNRTLHDLHLKKKSPEDSPWGHEYSRTKRAQMAFCLSNFSTRPKPLAVGLLD